MDPVPLDPRDYGGSYKLVGGRPALDLVNTVSWPGLPRQHDWFDPVENVPRWALAVGITAPEVAARLTRELTEDPARAARELGAVRRLRATLAEVVVPRVRDDAPSRSAVTAFNRLLARAAPRRQLDPDTLAWTFEEPAGLEHALAPAVVDAADVLTGADPGRLGQCPGCDWVFLDTTRSGRRRWCDMADCGSRAKARAHYARRTHGT
jgi:predicted RNA-binding Zn ribbon-like protein